MRILFITHSFPRWSGDIPGSFILRLAGALTESGVEVCVVAPAASNLPLQDTFDGVTVSRFRYAPPEWQTLAYTGTMAEQVAHSVRGKIALAGLLLGGVLALRRHVAIFSPDVVHAHWWFPGAMLALGTRADVPLVTTLHGSDVRLAQDKAWASSLFRRVISRSVEVTAVSSWLADRARMMAPTLRVAVEPMPVNVDLFTPGGDRHTSRFLFVGRLNLQKGIGLLLEALATTTPGAGLDVVGDGPDREILGSRVSQLGLSSRVTFHGSRSQEQLVPLYRAATAVVLPSENEGLGLVAIEAQLCETPVIAFRSGGIPDVVKEGQTGLLVEPGDVRALSSAMTDLLARGDRGAALGRAGRLAALAMFSPIVVAARYRRVYEQAVSSAA